MGIHRFLKITTGFWICVAVFVCGIGDAAVCGQDRFVTLSTVKARPLAMGGAFLSVEDDLAALDFNPAGFSMNTLSSKAQVSVFFNPLGPILLLENRNKVSVWDVSLGWVVRGIAFSVGSLHIGVLLGEEVIADNDRLMRSCLWDGTGYSGQRNMGFGVSLSLASRVSLGIAGDLFVREEGGRKKFESGYRYGIIVKTRSNLDVGLCFVDFPKEYRGDRMALERLADETLNIGVSYAPWKALTLALDVRNVSDEGKGVVREPHVGFEVTPWHHLTLRGGYYSDWKEKRDTYSAGLGLFDWNSMLPEHRRFSHATFAVNTTVVWQRAGGIVNRWFFLSCVLRI
jgi:hypothetical protein